MNALEIQRLNDLTERYEALKKPIRISKYNTPTNRNEEKLKLIEAFGKRTEYNPQFTYQPAPEEWEKPLVDFVRQLDPHLSEWNHYLYQDARRSILELEATAAHAPHQITADTIYTYGLPSQALIEEAHRVLAIPIAEMTNPTANAELAAERVTTALAEAGLQEWKVEISETMNARMMVRAVEKKVFIRSDAHFSEDSIRRLLVHEIGTHVFRRINGEQQPLQLLRLGLLGYLDTEEGLATYHEKLFGTQDVATLHTYALRVLAAHLSLSHSFFEVFLQLAEYSKDLDSLFDIVTRAKRGFEDTAAVGGHLKDQVYLRGFINISGHLDSHPEDHNILMCGKVSLDMVNQLRELERSNLLAPVQYMPSILL